MKKKWSYAIFIAMIVMSFPAASVAMSSNEGQIGESSFKVNYVEAVGKAALMIGGDETDMGFSYTAIQGMYKLRDVFGWEISISRQVQYPDQSRIASEYGDAGYDVVFCVGGQFIETTYFDVASKYNDTFWVQIPGLNEYVYAPDNLVGLHPSFQAAGCYLAGVLAGSMTETDRIGAIFGEWYEYLSNEFFAFKAGVESVNDDAYVYCRVAGTWGDAAIGKQIAEALISAKNVDIIIQIADTTGRGVIAACQAAGIAVIGSVGDQAVLAPEITMTSVGMDTSLLMETAAKFVDNGTANATLGGTSWKLPIGNYLHPYHQFEDVISNATKDLIVDVKKAIDNGTLVVPLIDADVPEDPDANDTTVTTTVDTTTVDTTTTTTTGTSTPGFQLLELLAATLIGIPIVMRKRRKR